MLKKLMLSLAVVGALLVPVNTAQAGRIVYRNGWGGRYVQPYYGNRVYRYGYYPRPYYGGYYAAPYGTYYSQPYGAYYAQPYGGYYVNGAYVAPYYPVY